MVNKKNVYYVVVTDDESNDGYINCKSKTTRSKTGSTSSLDSKRETNQQMRIIERELNILNNEIEPGYDLIIEHFVKMVNQVYDETGASSRRSSMESNASNSPLKFKVKNPKPKNPIEKYVFILFFYNNDFQLKE
jgi:hypothetical protein